MSWLDTDAEAEARYRALEALPADAAATPRWLEALRDDSWRVRRLAVDRLARLPATQGLVDALLALLRQRDATGARNAAASVLAQLGPTAAPALLALLDDAAADQRRYAAELLGALGVPEAVPRLVSSLRDADVNVRAAAAEALGRLGGPAARRALESLLASADPLLRVCGLDGLERLGPPPLALLVPLLGAPLTRAAAYRLLGRVEHPSAWRYAVAGLRHTDTRDAALLAFAGAGAPEGREAESRVALALASTPDGVAWLEAALGGEDDERLRGALRVARAVATPSLALAVARAAGPQGRARLSLEALRAMGLAGARALLEATGELMGLHPEARAVAQDALAAAAGPSLVGPLVALLTSGDAEWAEAATRALGRTGDVRAIAPLVEAFDDEAVGAHAWRALRGLAQAWPAEVREALERRLPAGLTPALVRAWADVAGAGARPVVARALTDASEALRRAAAEAAPEVPEALPLVRAALMDEAPGVRRAAARAMARLPRAAAAPLLAHSLGDDDVGVLAAACESAARAPGEAVAARLVALCGHPQPAVALAAIDALATLDALEPSVLEAALVHPAPEVLRRVFELGAAVPAVVARAASALRHPRWDVRAAAVRLLMVAGVGDYRGALEAAAEAEADEVVREQLESALRLARAGEPHAGRG